MNRWRLPFRHCRWFEERYHLWDGSERYNCGWQNAPHIAQERGVAAIVPEGAATCRCRLAPLSTPLLVQTQTGWHLLAHGRASAYEASGLHTPLLLRRGKARTTFGLTITLRHQQNR